jgi:hypothetical protein
MPEIDDPRPVEPQGGAGLFDVDPPQDVDQDPNPERGDADVFPEDLEL